MMGYAILCPGQGAQHPALFELVRDEPAAQGVLKAAQAALGRDLDNLMADPTAARANLNAQLLIVAAGVAVWRALASALPAPMFIAGYSVGEMTAHGCAQSFEVDELFAVVRKRAALMSEFTPANSGLIAVRGSNDEGIADLCAKSGAHIAIINGPDRHVVAGPDDALARFGAEAVASHLVVTRLSVEIAAHTPYLHQAAIAFRSVLEASDLRTPQTAVLAGIDGRKIAKRADVIDTLAMQIETPVNWHRCMTSLIEQGCRIFLELPPGRGLSQMLHEEFPHLEARAVEDFRSLHAARMWLRRRM